MRNFILIFCSIFLGFSNTNAQEYPRFTVGPGINNYGFSLAFQSYHNPTKWALHPKYFQGPEIELGNIYHPKEIALINSTFPGTSVYKMGKVNYAWALRCSYQWRVPLTYRSDRKSVAMQWVTHTGISLAYHWPVYIQYFNPDTAVNGREVVRYNPEIHSQSLIFGRQSWTSHFGSGSFTPGLVLKSGLEFIWGNYFNNVKVIETGIRIEAFSNRIPILYKNYLNKSVYGGIYFQFAFGSSE